MPVLGFKTKEEKLAIPILLEGYHELFEVQRSIGKEHAFNVMFNFFKATSKLHDNIEIIEAAFRKNKKMTDIFNKFKTEVTKGGRSEHGINRTKKGETVSADKIFLGDTHGLNTLPLTTWWHDKNYSRKDFKGTYSGVELDYNPIYEQAYDFVNSYFHPKNGPSILDLIKQLLAALNEEL